MPDEHNTRDDAKRLREAEEIINGLLDYAPNGLPGPNHEKDITHMVFALDAALRGKDAEIIRLNREVELARLDAAETFGRAEEQVDAMQTQVERANAERASIVAWLNEQARLDGVEGNLESVLALVKARLAIERGDHAQPEPARQGDEK